MRKVTLLCAGLIVAVLVAAQAAACPITTTATAIVAPAKAVTSAAVTQGKKAQSRFVKLYQKRIFRERVWFNGREGDLEKHAIFKNGQWYITLTDLMRHLGGTIIWGPSDKFIEVRRKGVVVRVVPSKPKRTRKATANVVPVAQTAQGQIIVTWPVAMRLGDRTWVAVKPFAELFGASVTWNAQAKRVDVTFAR